MRPTLAHNQDTPCRSQAGVMRRLSDWPDPFDVILDFERKLADWIGAPWCVTTDCCSHAMEIAWRLRPPQSSVSIVNHTYISVPQTLIKLNIPYSLRHEQWQDMYHCQGSDVWDSARSLQQNQYQAGQIQCVSFGRGKPLSIGIGGALFTDDESLYESAHRMRYDGRDIRMRKQDWWSTGSVTTGYHYNLRPEEALIGLDLLEHNNLTPQPQATWQLYPDCSKIKIIS